MQSTLLATGLALLLLPAFARAADVSVVKNLCYAEVGGQRLLLDLHKPAGNPRQPLIVWVHGGAWRTGSKSDMPLGTLVSMGYAVASVDYRLSPIARFPAQVHDIKAAIRYLRAEQQVLGIDAKHVAIAGSSAGGHLAALVGISNGHRELEGDVGESGDESSDVQAVISFYGMSNFTTILQQSTPHGLKVRVPALELLLGGPPEAKSALARLASPVFHVDERDPPLLLLHGDQDVQAPINQSHELHGVYEQHQLPVRFEVLHGAGHGGKEFYDAERLKIVEQWLSKAR